MAQGDPLPKLTIPGHEANRVALDALHQTTSEWIQVERAIKEEEDRGKRQLASLRQLKEVVTSQRDRWEKEALALEKSASKADDERDDILKEQADLESSRNKAIAQLKVLESQIKELKPMMPEPLRKELAIPFLRLARPFREEGWLDRYQATMEILQRTHAFHRRYSVIQHDIRIGEGKSQAGAILYMGLSNGYFLSVDGKKAAWGRPNPKGWSWLEADEHLDDITHAIAMAEGGTLEFELAQLPVEVKP